jgi:hypothetical protein
MPTLQEVTATHSQRLSALHQRRDQALREAQLARDAELRGLDAAAAVYARFDKAVAAALGDRTASEHKAAATRQTALARAASDRAESLSDAHARRRTADLEALERKTRAEAAAEKKFQDAMATLGPATSLEARQKVARDAEHVRQREVDDARDAYAAAINTAQNVYRTSMEGALIDERQDERAAEHVYQAAHRSAAAVHDAAFVTAERELFQSLQRIPEAAAAMERYQRAVTRIREDAAREEQALFTRFREELSLVS